MKSAVWPKDDPMPSTPTDEPTPVCDYCGQPDCDECEICGGPECHPLPCSHWHCVLCRMEITQ